MSVAEAELLASRREKLVRLRAQGVEPYPYSYARSHTAGEVRAAFAALGPNQRTGSQVGLAGRLTALRRMGKAAFANLLDRSGQIQLYMSTNALGPDLYERFTSDLDLGDIVGVAGEPFTTKTGELTVDVREFTLLAKSLRPLPEKWHGLKDVETRYRQRALDLVANEEGRRILRQRAEIFRTCRAYLDSQGFIEVETPMLQSIYGGATARPFITHHNLFDRDLYLRVAPELYLKRLLVGGMEKVYELGRNFRNEGISSEHNPEFTALEAYEAYTDYEGAMELAEEMVEACVLAMFGGTRVAYQGREVDFTRPWRRAPLLDLVAAGSGCDVEKPLPDLVAEIEQKGMPLPAPLRKGPKGKVIEHLLETQVQEGLWNPTFVLDFPLDISPLAKRKRGWDDLVERFELYITGREIANAFSELNDPADQRERFALQDRLRAAGDDEAQPIDEDFVRDLELGMPPAAGIGFGMDRLVMVLVDAPSIREVLAFPLLR
ncbi:TPA: lysine--tRNA ligase [Candidatus Acetothermia bacterium]|nr:lysine--tRNA ligase [Candidatus Acetothermia bacterium]